MARFYIPSTEEGKGYTDVSGIKSIANYTGTYLFANAKVPDTVRFTNLESIGDYGLYYGFRSTSIKHLYFPKLNRASFSSYTSQFNYMLYEVNGCTVHFPIIIKKTIENWEEVEEGFRGTNTTILYDLNSVHVTVNISGSNNYTLYLDGEEVQSTFDTYPEDQQLTIIDHQNSKIIYFMLTGLVVDDSKEFNIDLDTYTTKVGISTGITGLTTTIKLGTWNLTPLQDSLGNYYIITNSSGESVSYTVESDDTYYGESGTITTTGSEILEVITVRRGEYVAWTRPNLTENGTMGRTVAATQASSQLSSTYYAWKAFDSSTTTYHRFDSSSSTYIKFYNPDKIKIQSLTFTFTSTAYSIKGLVVSGSNDNENWTELGTYTTTAATSYTVDVNSPKAYKYHMFTYTRAGSSTSQNPRTYDIAITATAFTPVVS